MVVVGTPISAWQPVHFGHTGLFFRNGHLPAHGRSKGRENRENFERPCLHCCWAFQAVHSDQGENHILTELCRAFNITKSHTIPYHPMGDGLGEQMNRTLATESPTHIHTSRGIGWNIFNCCFSFTHTTKHSSTGISPHNILNPPSLITPNCNLPEIRNPMEYSDKLLESG